MSLLSYKVFGKQTPNASLILIKNQTKLTIVTTKTLINKTFIFIGDCLRWGLYLIKDTFILCLLV